MQSTVESVDRFEVEEDRELEAPEFKGMPSSEGGDPAIAGTAETTALVPTAPQHYIAGLVLLTCLLLGAVAVGNRLLMPWMHMPVHQETAAQALLNGQNVGLFDLNIDIRGIRRAQFAAMKQAPAVMLLGASQLQEASADLLPGVELFNAHVHRDYYDDTVAAIGLLLKNGLLPRTLVISIRDATFTSVASRSDSLWVPFIPDYQEAEKSLGITPRPWWENIQPKQFWDLFSLSSLSEMALKWMRAPDKPGPTFAASSETLDILMADGSIRWSEEHRRLFTQKRAKYLAVAMAQKVSDKAPEIDPVGVAAFSAALARLQQEGVEVILLHMPYNPDFYDRITGTTFDRGITSVIELTKRLAETYDFKTAGSLNPHDMGCTSEMYIDAEHSGAPCLERVLAHVASRFTR